MILHTIILAKYNWSLRVMLYFSCNDASRLIDQLDIIECPKYLKEEALSNFKSCGLNKGLTYSSYTYRTTLIIIGKASSVFQFQNTLVHELYHVIEQLKSCLDLKSEEERAYLLGDLFMLINKVFIFK